MTKKTKKPNKATRILTAVEPKREKAGSQITRLAAFIWNEIPGEPSTSEGAVDTAIRLLRHSYGPEGLTIPCDRTAEEALVRLSQFINTYVPIETVERVGREKTDADTAINLLYLTYSSPVTSGHDDLPGMWDKSDLTGGATDQPDNGDHLSPKDYFGVPGTGPIG